MCVASGITERQDHHFVCRGGRRGPMTASRTSDANLDFEFVKNALIFNVPKLGGWLGPPWPLLVFASCNTSVTNNEKGKKVDSCVINHHHMAHSRIILLV